MTVAKLLNIFINVVCLNVQIFQCNKVTYMYIDTYTDTHTVDLHVNQDVEHQMLPEVLLNSLPSQSP